MDITSGLRETTEAVLRSANEVRTAMGELPAEGNMAKASTLEGVLPGERTANPETVFRNGELPGERPDAALARPEAVNAVEPAEANRFINRNADLEGKIHPDTGVPYHRVEVELPEGRRSLVVPEFSSTLDVQLPTELHRQRPDVQNGYCNNELRSAVERSPALRANFNEQQLEQIADKETPDGYTWHHNEQPGKMQLVNSDIHQAAGHTGGNSLWGENSVR